MIAFVGSVFSPYYARARRRGIAQATEHCAINVALYGARKRWAMTERDAGALERGPAHLVIGPSSLRWQGAALEVQFDEVTMPIPSRLRGRLRVQPVSRPEFAVALDEQGRHAWSPIAPHARIEVELDSPRSSWSGTAYVDSNAGTEPLEQRFRSWHWSRAHDRNGDTRIYYDVQRIEQPPLSLSLLFDRRGGISSIEAPAAEPLPPTLWRIDRSARTRRDVPPGARASAAAVTPAGVSSAAGEAHSAVREPVHVTTLEDTPFYARSLLIEPGSGARVMHESLSLQRFDNRLVQAMLPFRMPRRGS